MASTAPRSTPSRSTATARPPPRPTAARSRPRSSRSLEGGVHDRDEGIRPDASVEGLAALKTIAPDGRITAGNASQICDGASGVLVVSEAALKLHGLTPLARIDNLTVTAGDPVIMLDEPINATRRALAAVGAAHGRNRPVRGQ